VQLQVRDLKARIVRLEQLAKGLAKEVALQRGAEDVLLSRERKQYLGAIQDAFAGADTARVVLAGVVKRLEGR
jgi:transposase-like protein